MPLTKASNYSHLIWIKNQSSCIHLQGTHSLPLLFPGFLFLLCSRPRWPPQAESTHAFRDFAFTILPTWTDQHPSSFPSLCSNVTLSVFSCHHICPTYSIEFITRWLNTYFHIFCLLFTSLHSMSIQWGQEFITRYSISSAFSNAWSTEGIQ